MLSRRGRHRLKDRGDPREERGAEEASPGGAGGQEEGRTRSGTGTGARARTGGWRRRRRGHPVSESVRLEAAAEARGGVRIAVDKLEGKRQREHERAAEERSDVDDDDETAGGERRAAARPGIQVSRQYVLHIVPVPTYRLYLSPA